MPTSHLPAALGCGKRKKICLLQAGDLGLPGLTTTGEYTFGELYADDFSEVLPNEYRRIRLTSAKSSEKGSEGIN